MGTVVPVTDPVAMPTPSCRMKAGFSLVELLVVVAVVVVITGLAVPAFNSISRSSGVALAGDMVMGQLALARQAALARNRPVEVRFYRIADPDGDGSMEYRALQLFEVLPDGNYTPLGRVERLPGRVIISETSGLSTLISSLADDTTNYGMPSPLPAIPALGSYTGLAFRILPNGSTDLPAFPASEESFHMTLHTKTEPIENGRPINFVTVQIDPINGSLRSFRP